MLCSTPLFSRSKSESSEVFVGVVSPKGFFLFPFFLGLLSSCQRSSVFVLPSPDPEEALPGAPALPPSAAPANGSSTPAAAGHSLLPSAYPYDSLRPSQLSLVPPFLPLHLRGSPTQLLVTTRTSFMASSRVVPPCRVPLQIIAAAMLAVRRQLR